MPMDSTQQRSRVLCFSRDPRLLNTRWMVLAKHYDAVSVGSIEEMLAIAGRQPIRGGRTLPQPVF